MSDDPIDWPDELDRYRPVRTRSGEVAVAVAPPDHTVALAVDGVGVAPYDAPIGSGVRLTPAEARSLAKRLTACADHLDPMPLNDQGYAIPRVERFPGAVFDPQAFVSLDDDPEPPRSRT